MYCVEENTVYKHTHTHSQCVYVYIQYYLPLVCMCVCVCVCVHMCLCRFIVVCMCVCVHFYIHPPRDRDRWRGELPDLPVETVYRNTVKVGTRQFLNRRSRVTAINLTDGRLDQTSGRGARGGGC